MSGSYRVENMTIFQLTILLFALLFFLAVPSGASATH